MTEDIESSQSVGGGIRLEDLNFSRIHDLDRNNIRVNERSGLPMETSSIKDLLDRRISEAIAKDEPVAIASFDMDWLGGINIKYGHDAGDKAIGVWMNFIKESIGTVFEEDEVYVTQPESGRSDETKLYCFGIDDEQIEQLVQAIGDYKGEVRFTRQEKDVEMILPVTGKVGFVSTIEQDLADEYKYPDHLRHIADARLAEAKVERIEIDLQALDFMGLGVPQAVEQIEALIADAAELKKFTREQIVRILKAYYKARITLESMQAKRNTN